MTLYKQVDGEDIELTPEEVAEWEAEQAALVPLSRPTTAGVVALAELGVVDGEITGIETACGIGFAMIIDTGVFWLFFSTPEEDTKYLPFVQSPGVTVDVTARETDYLEVTVRDRATNEPTTPVSLAVTVQRIR